MTHLLRWLRQLTPITDWLPGYDNDDFRTDVLAGLTVGVMLIPQGMAYAVLGGLPPIYGLYAALVPLLVYPLLGTSRQLITGPVAIDMLILAAGVGLLADPGSNRYVALAVMAAAIAGALQLGMGALRLGFVADLLSRPVIAGFTTAAAFIIAASQLGPLLGIDLERSAYVHELVADAAIHAHMVHVPSAVVGGLSIVCLLAIARWRPKWPSALIVAAVATLLGWILGGRAAGVEVIGSVPTGLPSAGWPDISQGDLWQLLPTAATLAVVQFMSVISLGRVFAKEHRYAIDANRELFAVGSANLIGSVFQSVPVSGSFSRSAVNDRAGAKTPVPNAIAAILIGATLLVLTPLVYHMPMPAIAAIIVVSGAGLIDIGEIKYLVQTKRREAFIAVLTMVITLTVGIQEGILVGVAASIVAALYRLSRPKMAELGHVPGTRSYHDLRRMDGASPIDSVLILRVNAAFTFANAEYFKNFILDKSRTQLHRIEAVVIDGASINDLDTTAAEALDSILDVLDEEGIDLYFTGLIGPVRDLMRRAGLWERLGEDHFYKHPHEAVLYILRDLDHDDGGDRLNTYLSEMEPPEPEREFEE
ncbi:sodium-independent anion transporter [Longibacter salinarum]|uniref:Sodium-independent anion transporter n=1 Tax=Longibacter salinarum TaxID=1850348 RepID=A0A2A8CWA0_9BACT|nr:sulfate permease [Longibacter salinarum]PEN13019.1 sodium-independent anion transporter [Longibacter salinarum]